jgi:hypothetical protein
MDTPDGWLNEWRSLGEADWRRWLGASGLSGADARPAALHEAGAAFTSFAEEFMRLARSAAGADPAAGERLKGELEALAQNLFARAVPAWPSFPGQGAEWLAALQAWSMVLAEIARATAVAFAARLGAPDPPTTLRAIFDAWIECAEGAFQSAAHSEVFAHAQARLFNELVRAKARQQAHLEQLARHIGMPTRREVDALYDELRALKAELAAARAAPAPAAPAAARRRRPSRKQPR